MCKAFDVVDVKNECVKLDVEFDVAKFERFDFLLIENENDFDSIIKREVDFHFRIMKKMIS